MAHASNTQSHLALLAAITAWKYDVRQAVISIGASQQIRKYLKAWYKSRPTRLNPNTNDGRGIYIPSTLPAQTKSIAETVREWEKEMYQNVDSFLYLQKIFNDWLNPGTRPLVPAVTIIVKHVQICFRQLRQIEQTIKYEVSGGRQDSTEDDLADFEEAKWFSRNTLVPPERLRKAAHRDTKHVRSKVVNNVTLYSKSDANKWWPVDMSSK